MSEPASQEEIEKLLRDNRRMLEGMRKIREDLESTLRDSEQRTKRILADLRRAGVLRD